MQAIVTKYIGPTDTKGARIKATCDAGSVTIPFPHAFSGCDGHAQAAMALVNKLGWGAGEYGARWDGASLPNQAGYVFTCHERNIAYYADRESFLP